MTKSLLPASFHLSNGMLSIAAKSADLLGIKGSKITAKFAVICMAIFMMVLTLSGSVLTNFHGSLSAKYLLPALANFMASLKASLNRNDRIARETCSGVFDITSMIS